MKKQLREGFGKIIFSGLGICYAVFLVYIFFFARRRWGPSSKRSFHLIPFRDKTTYLQGYGNHTGPENLEFYKDLVGNILLFIPLPFFLAWFFGVRSFRKLLLISATTSFSVELIQFILNIGVADVDDLLLNTMGASIGLLFLYTVSAKNNKSSSSVAEWRTVR